MALYIDLHTIQQYPLLYTPDADIYKLRSASKHNYLYLLDLVSKMHNLQKTSFVENTPAICKEVSPTFRFFYGITKLYLPGNSYAFHIKNIQYTLSLSSPTTCLHSSSLHEASVFVKSYYLKFKHY